MQRLIVTALLAVCATSPAWAWSNHALANYRAFEVMPEVAQAPAVSAEPLEAFLAAQAQPIAQLLADQDAWAQKHIAHYPPLPAPLRFDATMGTDFLSHIAEQASAALGRLRGGVGGNA